LKIAGRYQRSYGNNCIGICKTIFKLFCRWIRTRFPLQPRWYVLVFVIFAQSEPFFNVVSEEPRWYVIFSIAVVQPHLYLQYFLSRLNSLWLDNRACKSYTIMIKCLFSASISICSLICVGVFLLENIISYCVIHNNDIRVEILIKEGNNVVWEESMLCVAVSVVVIDEFMQVNDVHI